MVICVSCAIYRCLISRRFATNNLNGIEGEARFFSLFFRKRDIVVLDNLSSHKVACVKEAIASVGAKVVYLPPYSPDFNPIGNVFSKLKTMLRKLKLRTVEELWKKLGKLCDIFAPEECQNYFKHAGYYEITGLQTNS